MILWLCTNSQKLPKRTSYFISSFRVFCPLTLNCQHLTRSFLFASFNSSSFFISVFNALGRAQRISSPWPFLFLVVGSCALYLFANFRRAGHWIYHLWYLEYLLRYGNSLSQHHGVSKNMAKQPLTADGKGVQTNEERPGFPAERVFLVRFIPWPHLFYGKDKVPEICVGHLMFCFDRSTTVTRYVKF